MAFHNKDELRQGKGGEVWLRNNRNAVKSGFQYMKEEEEEEGETRQGKATERRVTTRKLSVQYAGGVQLFVCGGGWLAGWPRGGVKWQTLSV